MCGIAGIAGRNIDPSRVAAMLAAIEHRGPDGAVIEQLDGLSIAHVRLAIRDLSDAGRQPMVTDDSRWLLAFNGEIFNDAALRAGCRKRDRASTSDTETLLYAIAEHGLEVVRDCNAFFALVAVDLHTRKLYLGRDRFGVKPLYIATRGGEVMFGSEIGALIAAGWPRRANVRGLKHAIANAWWNDRATLIEGIEHVPPGSILTVSLDTLAIDETRFYEPASSVDAAMARELAQVPRRELQTLVTAALQRSVERRLDSQRPVGVLCSGGLDSSLIAHLASRVAPSTPAYVATIPGDENDELQFAKAVCRAASVPLRPIAVTPETWRSAFVEAVRHFEYPLVHESSIALSLLARAAREDGVRVLLSGEAADELFGGYGSRHLRERAAFAGIAPPDAPASRNEVSPLMPWLGGAAALAQTRLEAETFADASQAYAYHGGARGELEAALLTDLRNFLPHGLNRLDKNLMQFAVEVREPFLDRDLVALAVNLPLEHRLMPRPKGVLLDVGEALLPREVTTRPKIGFSFDPQRFQELVDRQAIARGALFEILGVPSATGDELASALQGRTLMRVLSAEVWTRLFICGASAKEVDDAVWLPESAAARSSAGGRGETARSRRDRAQ